MGIYKWDKTNRGVICKKMERNIQGKMDGNMQKLAEDKQTLRSDTRVMGNEIREEMKVGQWELEKVKTGQKMPN